MVERDADGFSINGDLVSPPVTFREPPPIVAMPKFFDGCHSPEEATARMIDELNKPASINGDGFDTMYRRLADALILVLANQGGLTP